MSNKKVYPSFVDFKKGAEGENAFGSLVGFVARDPELRYTQTGKAVANTAIPVNLAGKNLNYVLGSSFPESGDDPIWIEVTAWEKTAEMIDKAGVAKGDQVVVSGFLSLDEYEGKEKARLNVSRFNVLRRKNPQTSGPVGESNIDPIDISDDDLPF